MSDRHLLLFGASGRTGALLVDAALAAGWRVTGVARSTMAARDGFTPVRLDALDAGAVAEAVGRTPADTAVWLIGARDDVSVEYDGPRHALVACRAAGIVRFVMVTSLGCGASRAFASPRLLAAIGPVLEAKTRGEETVAASDRAWTIIRPAGLVDGAGTGTAVLDPDPSLHGRIRRADLAALVLATVDDPGTIRQCLTAVDPGLAETPSAPTGQARA